MIKTRQQAYNWVIHKYIELFVSIHNECESLEIEESVELFDLMRECLSKIGLKYHDSVVFSSINKKFMDKFLARYPAKTPVLPKKKSTRKKKT